MRDKPFDDQNAFTGETHPLAGGPMGLRTFKGSQTAVGREA